MKGEAYICDLNFGAHTIPHRAKGVQLRHDSQHLHGLQRNEGNLRGFRMSKFCLAEFRVVSTERTKLAEARVTEEGRPQVIAADRYGRLRLTVREGETGRFMFSLPGYEDQLVEIPCKNQQDVQRVVVMRSK